MMNRERIVKKNDVAQFPSSAQHAQLRQNILLAPPAPVLGRALIQLIKHPRAAIRTRKWAPALRRKLHYAVRFVQHVACSEREAVEWLHRLSQHRPESAPHPNIRQTMRAPPCRQGFYKVQ